MVDDIAGVATTVGHLFEQVVKLLEENRFKRLVAARIKVAQQVEHQLVRFAFQRLKIIVVRFDLFEVNAAAQLRHSGSYPEAGEKAAAVET